MDLHLTPGIGQLRKTHLMIPHPRQMPQDQLYLKEETLHQIFVSRWIRSTATDAKNGPILQMLFKVTVGWKSTKTQGWSFHTCKGPALQTHHRLTPKFLALVIPKAWKYTVLLEAHDTLGHQESTWTYCLIKQHYYWKGMNKDIRKYIVQCALCCRGKAKVQAYSL